MSSYSWSTRPFFAPGIAAFAVLLVALPIPAFAASAQSPIIYVAQDGVGDGAYGDGKLSILSADPAAPVRDIDSFINQPRIAVDAAGNIYAVSYHSGTVTRYPPGGGGGTVLMRGLLGPTDIVIDRDGGMYITEDPSQELLYFPPTGGRSVVANKRVNRLVLDENGNLYFSAAEERSVYKRVAQTGELQLLITGVSRLGGLAVGGGDIYFSADDVDNADPAKGAGPGIYRYHPAGYSTRIIRGEDGGALAVDASGVLYFTWDDKVFQWSVSEGQVKVVRLVEGLIYPRDLVVTSRPGLPPAPLRITQPNAQGPVTTQRPTISGTGAPGAAVKVSLSVAPADGGIPIGSEICNALINEFGNWNCELTMDLAPGNTFGFLAFAWIDGQPSTAQTSVFIDR